MASGLPVVATRVSGSNELVLEGKTGAAFDVDDAEGLAAAVARVHGGDAAEMGRHGRQLVETHFDIDQIADRYEGLYQTLMTRRTPRPPAPRG